MQKVILTGSEAREKIYAGVKKVADAVVSTLGPMGRNVIISRCQMTPNGMQYYMPYVTKDGVSVAKSITLDDQLENVGALLVRQASDKTMTDAGDGTTTTCLLMKSILEKGIELVNSGVNPQELKKGIDDAVKYVVEELKKMAIPVGNDIEKIRQVATVSANNDSVIGDLIADAFEKIGVTGDIDIEEAKGVNTEIKVADGYKFSRGWLSPYFINNTAKNECELINPYILLYDKKISLFSQIEKLIVETTKEDKPLLIICDDSDGEAFAAMTQNTLNGLMKVCVVRLPEFGDLKREAMEDLALITGATYISDEKGLGLKGAALKHLGSAAKVIVSKNDTVIIGGNKKEELNELLDNLKMNLTKEEGEDKIKTEKRIAKLTGGIAVIYVGAATEVEMKEKKDRVDDAIRATKAAIAEGFVPGGGTAFIRCMTKGIVIDIDEVKRGSINEVIENFKQTGVVINGVTPLNGSLINSILIEPLKQICINAGVSNIDENIKQVSISFGNMGFNAKIGKHEDLVLSGIIDPVKVLRCSLENAASAATMILTSETLIGDSF